MPDGLHQLRGKRKITVSIGTRLLLSFIAVVLLVSVIRTGTSVVIQNQISRQNALHNLATIAALQETEVRLWLDLLKTNLSDEINSADFRNNASSILKFYSPINLAQPAMQDKPGLLAGSFNSLIEQNQLFDDLILVDLQGKVYVTTKMTLTNLNQINSEWDYIAKGKSALYSSPLFLNKDGSSAGTVTLITSIPVTADDGTLIGILAGRANLGKLFNILGEKSGLGVTGQAFLVDQSGNLLTEMRMRDKPVLVGTKLTTQGIIDAQKLETGTGGYTDYGGSPVFGAFRWNPGLQAFLFIEQEQAEALSAANEPILINVAAAILALVLSVVAALIVTRSITSPITNLVHVARQVAGGNLDVRAKDMRQDEIGILGQTLNTMTDQLRSSIINLEKKVTERTQELEHRTIQIQVASEIARDAALATNLEDVLNRAVNLISDKFGFYHAAIFLIDESHEYAVLKAATGDAGRALLERNHKLKIGEMGLVGIAAGKGQPRIAMDVDADMLHYRNPLLPMTKSEMALPLKTGDHIIGVLDVQSTVLSAFNQDDVNTLQTLADQLAVAIEKTRLLQQYQKNLAELTATYRQYTQRGWSDFISQSRRKYSLRYKNSRIESTDDHSPEAMEALIQNETVKKEKTEGPKENEDGFSSLSVPIRLRGQSLGVLTIKFQSQQINNETSKLIENISDRLALALENARLLEQIQRQAERDHVVSEITTKIRASNDIDLILQTAIKELGRSLGVSKTSIQLRGQDLDSTTPHENEIRLPGLTGAVHKEVL
jgi:GAF domain-containing protein/HAMP domain-containing protein